MPLDPRLVEIALEHCSETAFERYSQTVFGAVFGSKFIPLGGKKDGGADGFIDLDISETVGQPTRFFQASKEVVVDSKIKKTVARLKEVGRDVRSLMYASSQAVTYSDKLEFELSEELGVQIRIYNRLFFSQHANTNGDTIAAFDAYLRSALDFLQELKAPSYPQNVPFNNARAICAFLGQEIERRVGISKTLDAVCDALILWALEGTDPDRKLFLKKDEIIAKVENVIPTARYFFRNAIAGRLEFLTTKIEGVRTVNAHNSGNDFCLPFETRRELEQHTIDDEKLKLDVTTAMTEKLAERADDTLTKASIEKICLAVHSTLETVFERQGLEASRHFLTADQKSEDAFDKRAIVEIANDALKELNFRSNSFPEASRLCKELLREMFYASSPVERAYCQRLSRTYMLLFTIRNTPEVIEYFNSMAKSFVLYVGTDLVVRAISEFFLNSENQMTINAFKIIRQAGSKIILSEIALREIHSHVWAADREYVHNYQKIDSIVDRDLASECDRILIRAYFYTKLDASRPDSPKSWPAYLNNFLTLAKFQPGSEASMRALRDTLCNMFGFEYEAQIDTESTIDHDELAVLTSKIIEIRAHKPDPVLAENDALHILRIHSLRKVEDRKASHAFGTKSWWLTQDTISGRAAAIAFPSRASQKYVMRPEFLINYIAHNPATAEVRESLHTIFPSLLGIRLGSRLSEETLDRVLQKVRVAYDVSPARAAAIVAEHSDALKADHLNEFAIKYGNATDTESGN